MNSIELLSKIERIENGEVFVNLHIVNDTVVGFYETQIIKYKNIKNEEIPYLFPTTFRYINGLIHTSIVVGSVDGSFNIPRIYQFDDHYGTILQTYGIQSHLYKLLAVSQYIKSDNSDHYDGCEGLNIKMLMDSIYQLDRLGFPFMRITNNESIIENNDY